MFVYSLEQSRAQSRARDCQLRFRQQFNRLPGDAQRSIQSQFATCMQRLDAAIGSLRLAGFCIGQCPSEVCEEIQRLLTQAQAAAWERYGAPVAGSAEAYASVRMRLGAHSLCQQQTS